MDKLTAIKIKYQDGTYSDEIPISALAQNVQWDNTYNLIDVLGDIDVDVSGSVQDQISQLFNQKVSASEVLSYITPIQNQINQLSNEKLDSEDMPTYIDPLQDQIDSLSSTKISGSDMPTYTDPLQNQIDQLSITKVSDSDMQSYIRDSLPVYVSEWLDANVDPIGSAVTVDDTLTISGSAADSEKVGRELNNIRNNLDQYVDIFTGDVGESVENWLDEHPEATTTVEDDSLTTEKYQDNSITEEKIVNKAISEDKLSNILQNKLETNSLVTDLKMYNYKYWNRKNFLVSRLDPSHISNPDESSWATQLMDGGTIHNGKIYMMTFNNDSTVNFQPAYILETRNLEITGQQGVANSEISRQSSALVGCGRPNDITYCNVDDCFYIAAQDQYHVCKVNATTLQQLTNVEIDNTLTFIHWDNNNQYFFCGNGQIYYKYTYDWQLIETGDAKFRRDGFGGTTTGQNGQSIFSFGKYYGWITNYITNYNTKTTGLQNLYMKNVFIIFDPITFDIICSFNFPAARGDDEIQWAGYDQEDGILYAGSGNNALRFYKIYIDRTKGKDIKDQVVLINTTGTILDNGAAISSITRPGYFYANSHSSNSTVLPITGAPGYYNINRSLTTKDRDAQYLQIPFGLNDFLGLFFTGTRASLRYNNQYSTFLTHKDLTIRKISHDYGILYVYSFMNNMISIATGTLGAGNNQNWINMKNTFVIPITFDNFPSSAFAYGAPIVTYNKTDKNNFILYQAISYNAGTGFTYKADVSDNDIPSEARVVRFFGVILQNIDNGLNYYK